MHQTGPDAEIHISKDQPFSMLGRELNLAQSFLPPHLKDVSSSCSLLSDRLKAVTTRVWGDWWSLQVLPLWLTSLLLQNRLCLDPHSWDYQWEGTWYSWHLTNLSFFCFFVTWYKINMMLSFSHLTFGRHLVYHWGRSWRDQSHKTRVRFLMSQGTCSEMEAD